MQLNSGSLQSASNATPITPAMEADFDRLSTDFRAFIGDCEKLLTSAQTLSGEGAAMARAEFECRIDVARLEIEIAIGDGDHVHDAGERTSARHRLAEQRLAVGQPHERLRRRLAR